MFEEPPPTDGPPASEEKGMSIPVIGSSEFCFVWMDGPQFISTVDSLLTLRV